MKGASSLIGEATRKLINVSKKYKIAPKHFRFSNNPDLNSEVNAIIKRLRSELYDVIEELAIVKEEEKEKQLTFLNSLLFGKTLKERIDIYTNRYKYEVEAAIAAGLFLDNDVEHILRNITTHHKAPYTNPDIVQSFGHGLSATRIKTEGISYGVGKSNSSFTSLEKLIRNTIASSWMYWLGEQALNKGAKGFFSYRGSSYPCAYCDSMTGYHPIDEYKYLWHPNCRCYFVFV